MAYGRLIPGTKATDPFDDYFAKPLSQKPLEENSYHGFYKNQTREIPAAAKTFAGYDINAARSLCKSRPHVILREDPMFGRRGYAREVIEDAEHGYLVLVIAFVARECPRMGWHEPFKPRACDRRYWVPARVEFV